MKRIFLIRHAKSSWEFPHLRDHDRPLNHRGLRDAPFMASMLRERYDRLDLIYSSTALRAKTTAEYFRDAFALSDSQFVLKSQLFHCTEDEITSTVKSTEPSADVVAVFGHNPAWTWYVNQIPKVRVDNMPTCGIAVIASEIDHWEDFDIRCSILDDFFFPKQFAR